MLADMASGTGIPDVSEQFKKMGEKLGWFKTGDLESTLKSLSKSSKKKSSKSRIQEKDRGNMKKEIRENFAIKKTKMANLQTIPKAPTSDKLRKQEIDKFLSSDSDTSFTTVPEIVYNKDAQRPNVIQICSDSEGEEQVKEDTYISCIGESLLSVSDCDSSNKRSSNSPYYRSDRNTEGSYEYDISIMGNRMSVTTLSIDVDSIGEPLVESTRIHRRSSVTYKQLMASPDGEESSLSPIPDETIASNNKVPVPENVNNDKLKTDKIEDNLSKEVQKLCLKQGDVNEMSDPDVINESPDVSLVKDVKYITALESLDDSVMDRISHSESPLKESNSSNSSRHSSNEYVEVIDAATQTNFNMDDCKPDSDQTVHNPVCMMYGNKTLTSTGKPSVYSEKTIIGTCLRKDRCYLETDTIDNVNPEVICADDEKSSVIITETQQMTGEIYEQSTIDDNVNGNDSVIREDKSTISEDNSVISEDVQVKVSSPDGMTTYSETSVDITHISENCVKLKASSLSDSDSSVYEVVDVGTQTDRTSLSSAEMLDDNIIQGNQEIVYEIENREDPSTSESKDKLSGVSDIEINDKDNSEAVDAKKDDQGNDSLEDKQCNIEEKQPFPLKTKNKGKYEQQPSHCFDLSSDSDRREGNESLKDNKGVEEPDLSKAKKKIQRKPKEKLVSKKKNKNKSIQKASHCFDLSSDSESQANLSDETVDSKKSDSSSNHQPLDKNNIDHSDHEPIINSDHTESGEESCTDKQGIKESAENPSLSQSSSHWRNSKRYKSESSDEDKLEAFFQKLKQPEKKKKSPASSPLSMDDFIIEDEDMTSESDNEVFYLVENQKLERAPLIERLKTNRQDISSNSESSTDDDFSSKLYPNSVTKHKQKKKVQSYSGIKSSAIQWESSDSEEEPPPRTKGRIDNKTSKVKTKNATAHCSDSDPDSPLFKTPNPLRRRERPATKGTNDQADKENIFKTPTVKPRSVASFTDYISLSDDDSSSDDDSLPSLLTTNNKNQLDSQTTPIKSKSADYSDVFKKMPTPLTKPKTPRTVGPVCSKGGYTCSFLGSLSITTEDHRRDPDTIKYIKNFKRTREDLVKHLFDLYNTTIFDKKLPSDLPIIWNKRLLKTAGYCAYRCNKANKEDRTARVELSTKVCDSAERVRDTLIHELCHAAVWLLDGVNGGHGNFWRYWARHASKVHPELPTISRCHSYSISTKFTYRCTSCGYSIGRHSKSLDTSRKVCGYCKGTFELIQNATPMTPQSASSATTSVSSTPRAPNRFAMFVKDNYNTVKQKNKDLKHGEVMKELSRLFAANKINS